MRTPEAKSNEQNIESAFRKIADCRVENLEPHFIYAGRFNFYLYPSHHQSHYQNQKSQIPKKKNPREEKSQKSQIPMMLPIVPKPDQKFSDSEPDSDSELDSDSEVLSVVQNLQTAKSNDDKMGANVRLLEEVLGELMKKYKIKSIKMTLIYMEKIKLITSEEMKSYCNGESGLHRISINDDLEVLFEELQQGNRTSFSNRTYFLPRLPEDKMELVEMKDVEYSRSFRVKNPDVSKRKMQLSKSESKFIYGNCYRKTKRITKPKPKFQCSIL